MIYIAPGISTSIAHRYEEQDQSNKGILFSQDKCAANVGYGMERSSLGTNTFDTSAPTFGAVLGFELPVFDGFLRDRSLQAARAELQAASEQLERTRDEAVQQVWRAEKQVELSGQLRVAALASDSHFAPI